jgi:hypothetical protein
LTHRPFKRAVAPAICTLRPRGISTISPSTGKRPPQVAALFHAPSATALSVAENAAGIVGGATLGICSAVGGGKVRPGRPLDTGGRVGAGLVAGGAEGLGAGLALGDGAALAPAGGVAATLSGPLELPEPPHAARIVTTPIAASVNELTRLLFPMNPRIAPLFIGVAQAESGAVAICSAM